MTTLGRRRPQQLLARFSKGRKKDSHKWKDDTYTLTLHSRSRLLVLYAHYVKSVRFHLINVLQPLQDHMTETTPVNWQPMMA